MWFYQSRLRRASASVPADIAEGRGRDWGNDAEFARFQRIATQSGCECECHIVLAHHDLLMLKDGASIALLLTKWSKTRQMLNALIQQLKANR